MYRIAALALALCACAEFNGQYSVKNTGHITLHEVVRPPVAPTVGTVASGGRVWDYYTAPTYGVFYIENGTNEPYVAVASCADGFDSDIDLPPHTGQRILVTTNIDRARRYGLCSVHDPR